MSHSFEPKMPNSSQTERQIESDPAVDDAFFAQEDPLSPEEQQLALELAQFVDTMFGHTRSSDNKGDIGYGDFLGNKGDMGHVDSLGSTGDIGYADSSRRDGDRKDGWSGESPSLASWAMLLHHSVSPPALAPERKAVIEQALYVDMSIRLEHAPTTRTHPSPDTDSVIQKLRWWAWFQHIRMLFWRPMGAVAALLLCVVGWGVFQTYAPSTTNHTSIMSPYREESTWFQGMKEQPTKHNPFLQTRSATERLKQATMKLHQWQRERWVTQLREHRYRS